MNDGEQQMMHLSSSGPLMRPLDLALRLQFAAQAACPGLCIGILGPDTSTQEALAAIGPTHVAWWIERGLPLAEEVFESGVFLGDRTYCFGLTTYRPKAGPARMSSEEFAEAWDAVFENSSVLVVAPPDARQDEEKALEYFRWRCGGCVPVSQTLHGRGKPLPPFRRARSVSVLSPYALPFSFLAAADWPHILAGVRQAADEANADVAAVAWGPFGDVLVSELACLGLRAIDIGNLIDILNGREQGADPDSQWDGTA